PSAAATCSPITRRSAAGWWTCTRLCCRSCGSSRPCTSTIRRLCCASATASRSSRTSRRKWVVRGSACRSETRGGRRRRATPPCPLPQRSERSQEVDQVLLIFRAERREVQDHGVRLTSLTGMQLHRLHDVAGASVVQEEHALPHSPQRRRAELVR